MRDTPATIEGAGVSARAAQAKRRDSVELSRVTPA
jgi:hypothetical protein